MVDPITIFGTAGAVANIIDLVGKTVKSLRDLHGRWKDADHTVLKLITQLTALKAALGKIQVWIDSDLMEQHHQFVTDLDLSVMCCRMLIDKVDTQVSEVHWTADDALDLGSKIKVVFGSKANEYLQKVIERQISALTLLLTACNCGTISEQQILLEKSSSRKTFKRVKDDSSSLYVNRNTASFHSRFTNSLSKMVFQFDRELFVSKVRERALRGSLKESLRRQPAYVEYKKRQRSRAINREIAVDRKRLRSECKVLLAGEPRSERETLMKQMKTVHHNSYSADEVRRAVLEAMLTVMENLRFAGIELNGEDMNHINTTLQSIDKCRRDMTEMSPAVAEAMKSLWDSPELLSSFHETVTSSSIHIPDSAKYWFKEIQRIAQPDYIPTESDILRIQDRSADVREYTFTTHKLNIRVFDWGVHNHKLVGMFHPFDALTSLLLVVDLSSYDEDEHHLPSGDSLNSVTTALETFGAIVNNQRFMRSGVILFFNKVGRFKQKLATHPLCNYFPDFSGGNNFERATDYIISRFHQVNQARRRIYIHFTESADRSNISMMFAAINDTLIRNGPPTAKLPTLRDLAIRIRKQTPKSQADNMSTTAIWAPIGYGYNPSTSLWLKTSAGNDSAPGQLICYQPSDFPVYSI